MAGAGEPLYQDQFICPICLDPLEDPVTIPCGHSYCMGCIKGCWDQEEPKGIYSCPQCRQTFSPRPALNKNTMFAEVVEKLKKTGLHVSAPARRHAEPGDVECSVCSGRKLRAVKSCFVCLDSYCEIHFRYHEELHSGKKHKVIDATRDLQGAVCSLHDGLMNLYCHTDQKCICQQCAVEEHKDHVTITTVAKRTEVQRQLGEVQKEFQQKIQEREKEVQELRKAVVLCKRTAQAAVDNSERIFTELIQSVERKRREVTDLIRTQEKAQLGRAEGLLDRLEQEIAELRRRTSGLDQLSHANNDVHFLRTQPASL
ncbi:E3 ubiquitin-protein ligase TRIM47 [Chanos chanos]|uniref:E3 ubiquitin-protein ligase TRIM47 n=1 Tax=Chanos chanos TaxID=29144 RepID=A0A6J2WYB9_CHACN|nr:E3 ubiquitin-protein ligase TRIM47-like [Chanos chanos]